MSKYFIHRSIIKILFTFFDQTLKFRFIIYFLGRFFGMGDFLTILVEGFLGKMNGVNKLLVLKVMVFTLHTRNNNIFFPINFFFGWFFPPCYRANKRFLLLFLLHNQPTKRTDQFVFGDWVDDQEEEDANEIIFSFCILFSFFSNVSKSH